MKSNEENLCSLSSSEHTKVTLALILISLRQFSVPPVCLSPFFPGSVIAKQSVYSRKGVRVLAYKLYPREFIMYVQICTSARIQIRLLQSLQTCRNSTLNYTMTAAFHNLLFLNHSIIRRCIVGVTAMVSHPGQFSGQNDTDRFFSESFGLSLSI